MSFKSVAIGCVLTSTVLSVQALTLGRARGAAWIGQPLDLVIPVQLDAGQTDSGVCAEADVFHADSRQDPARIRITTEPTAQPDTFNVRIVSAALVDEPVVTVYLRAGCNPKSSRKYVLLADFPSEGSAALSRLPEPVAPAVPTVVPAAVAPAAATASTQGTAAETNAGPAAAPAPAPAAAKPAAPRPPKPAAARKEPPKAPAPKPAPIAADDKPAASAPAAPKPTASNKPRLKLDPLENLTERIKTLESTTVAMPPENAASDAERMDRLQSDVRALLEQAAKNEANLTAMRERMEKAESERVPMGVVYGLVALVLACLGGLAYLWTRRSKTPVWDQAAPMAPLQAPHAAQQPAPAPSDATVPRTPAAAAATATSDMDVDVNLMDLDEESFSKLMDTPQPGAKSGS